MDDDDEDFEGYDPIEIHPILEDEDEEELPPRVKYSTFQEEEDFDPE